MVDGDTVFEPDTIRRWSQPLADPEVGAVSGNTKVGNRRGLLGRWQHIEYVIGFNLDRRMYEVLRCTPTVPGAIGAFRREALAEVGGVSGETLAEDTDLTLAIGRTGRRVVYAERRAGLDRGAGHPAGLWRQRYRWSYGTMQAVWKHAARVRLARPEAAPHRPPRAPLHGLLPDPAADDRAADRPVRALRADLHRSGARRDRAGWPSTCCSSPSRCSRSGSTASRLRPLWALPLQQFVYRQLMYLVIIESTISALVGIRAQWRTIERTGDVRVGVEA